MLAKAGHEVHFLFRSDFVYVRNHGLRVDSVNGDFHLADVNAYCNPQDMPKCDVFLVCLKTTGNHHLPELIKPMLHPGSIVVLLQNGLGLEEDISAKLPGVAIAGGLAFICSNKVGPGHIDHLDYGKLIVGSYNVPDQEIIQNLVADLKSSGIHVGNFRPT